MSTRVCTHPTLEGLLEEVIDLVMDGWVVDQSTPAESLMFGTTFIATLTRTDESVAAFKARAEAILSRPKLTVTERMAKAREARGKPKLDVGSILQDVE